MKAHKLMIQNSSFQMLLFCASYEQCHFLRSCKGKRIPLSVDTHLPQEWDSLLSVWAALRSYVGTELHLHSASTCLK